MNWGLRPPGSSGPFGFSCMSSLIRGVGREELNRNVFRSQEAILSRSKTFFCPSTWLEGVDQNASSEVAMLEINCDNMVDKIYERQI